MNSKFSFGEVYCQVYGGKFSFTATLKQSHRALFSTNFRRYTSTNKLFEDNYPHSYAHFTCLPLTSLFCLKLKRHKAASHL